jgi:hypothetical protein
MENRAAWEHAVSEPGSLDWLFLCADMLGYLVALVCFFSLSLATAQRLRGWPVVAVGFLGAVVYQGVYVIFVR